MANHEPHRKGDDGNPNDIGNEDGRDSVGQFLQRHFAKLGLLNERAKLRQASIAQYAFRCNHQLTVERYRAGGCAITRGEIDRHGFSRECAHVNGTLATGDNAIDRNALPRTNDDQVTDAKLLNRDADLSSGALDGGFG